MAYLDAENNIETFMSIYFAQDATPIYESLPRSTDNDSLGDVVTSSPLPGPTFGLQHFRTRRPIQSPPTTPSTTASPFPDGEIQWPFIFIVWLLVAVTVLGNILAITAFLRNSKIRSKVANHYIFNLCVADLLVGLLSMPINNVHLLYGEWPFGEFVCKLWLILDYTICFQGMTAIVFISMDRYCWVKWPIKYIRLQTRRRAIGTILVAWLGGFAYYIIHVLAWEHFEGLARVNYKVHCDLEIIGGLSHAIIAVLLEFVLPLVTVVTVNGIVYHKVRKRCGKNGPLRTNILEQRRPSNLTNVTINTDLSSSLDVPSAVATISPPYAATTQKQTTSSAPKPGKAGNPATAQSLPRHWKAAMTLSFMVVTLLILWLPYQVILIAAPVCNIKCVTDVMWESANYLLWSTAAVNPCIYAYTNVHYRKEMLTLLCFFRQHKCQTGTDSTRSDSSRSRSPRITRPSAVNIVHVQHRQGISSIGDASAIGPIHPL